MTLDFRQADWDAATIEDCRALVRLAVREDLERQQDWTTLALVGPDRHGAADLVARQGGVAAGIQAAIVALDEMMADVVLSQAVPDGQRIEAGALLGRLTGSVRDLLTCERIVLNLVGRLSGIATLASEFVQAVSGTKARLYDTRKTTPGWRRLEKFAVRCGGARTHRMGLYDAILIKDNHLAQFAGPGEPPGDAASRAIATVRSFLASDAALEQDPAAMILEIEVDSLEQLAAVLPQRPHIVLLDNMPLDMLRQAVALRDRVAPQVELEASGGVRLSTVREIAETGVDRVSVGALTHSARSLDVGLDWHVARG